MNKYTADFSWVGSQEHFVDQPDVVRLGHILIGRYGGNSNAGQYKNEDGCLVWFHEKEDWEFAILLDAHHSAESAELVIKEIEQIRPEIKHALSLAVREAFEKLEGTVLNLFQNQSFLAKCHKVKGETACLIVARKGKFVWWLSVGDCILNLHHPELAALGQYQLNQRHFYEWIGQVNTFDQAVPCYTSGRRELRQGINHLFLTTDGLIECPNGPFIETRVIFQFFEDIEDFQAVKSLLLKIQENGVRDSTTIITWKVERSEEASLPSDYLEK